MRADRLVSILLWLQVRGTTSTSRLARHHEVSERTIHRDMDALSAAGIPVFAMRGRNGGWALPDEYRGTARWLSADEVRALAVLGPEQMLIDLGLAGIAESAWLKLLAALPPPHRDEATHIHARIHLDPAGWRPRSEPAPWLPVLKQGAFSDRLVRMRYRRADGTTADRTIAPLGLVAKGITWYVVAGIDRDIRTYRASRVEEAELLDEQFERPVGFDLAASWEGSKASLMAGLPRYPVTLRVDATAIDTLRSNLRWGRIEHVAPVAADGWCEVGVTFELLEYALATVLSLGDRAEVLAPPELRDKVTSSLRATLARYDDHGGAIPRDKPADADDNGVTVSASDISNEEPSAESLLTPGATRGATTSS